MFDFKFFQALSMLLNAQSFPFVIDLACLASRRGYLKLEKWLTDKIRDHGESFVSACVKFLQVKFDMALLDDVQLKYIMVIVLGKRRGSVGCIVARPWA
jgi:hypothetical protein